MTIRYRVMRGSRVVLWSDLIVPKEPESRPTKPYAHGSKVGSFTNIASNLYGFDLFFNILQNVQGVLKIRLFLEDGHLIDGWINEGSPIEIFNEEELFDGRFNA